VSKYLHVPVQSGSNAVLARMKRGYTVEEYREVLARMREWIPGVAVTSDFIVGFCGEMDHDFELTMDLVRESRFKNSFIFKYSERPGTKGAELYADDVPEEVKRRRNNELLALQNEISEADNQAFLGQTVTVLVEGPSKATERQVKSQEPRVESREPRAESQEPASDTRHPTPDTLQLTGRTHCDRIVVFDGNRRQIGQFLPIVIYDANAHTLFGEVLTRHTGPELYTLMAPAIS
jgi:tRNA-2-methylthio-N6-dimethylallyladenosine synthase